jgi:hypothetical protein
MDAETKLLLTKLLGKLLEDETTVNPASPVNPVEAPSDPTAELDVAPAIQAPKPVNHTTGSRRTAGPLSADSKIEYIPEPTPEYEKLRNDGYIATQGYIYKMNNKAMMEILHSVWTKLEGIIK